MHDDALHHLRVPVAGALDRGGGAGGAGDGCLPDHQRGHHHHRQRRRHRGHLDRDDVLPLALRRVPLPDPRRGPEHGLRPGQGAAGGETPCCYVDCPVMCFTFYLLQQALRTRSCVLRILAMTHKQLVSCLQVVIKQVANR